MIPLAEIPFPDIDPIAFQIGQLKIRWYGIAFVMGFLVATVLLKKLSRERRLAIPVEAVGDYVVAAMLGVILGGRLGYIIFYDFEKYWADPALIPQVWRGGLSFHGGLVGCLIALWIFARRRGVSLLNMGDAAVLSATPGILFVRCANFVNGELWGRTTDVSWAMVFPKAHPFGVPRHPSQLYEGLLEGLLLFVLMWAFRNRAPLRPPGRLIAVFLLGYASLRFFVEFFRQPDEHLGTILGPLSMGQLLCLGMLLAGGVLFYATGRVKPDIQPQGRDGHGASGTGAESSTA